jgi:hypothetical protein
MGSSAVHQAPTVLTVLQQQAWMSMASEAQQEGHLKEWLLCSCLGRWWPCTAVSAPWVPGGSCIAALVSSSRPAGSRAACHDLQLVHKASG